MRILATASFSNRVLAAAAVVATIALARPGAAQTPTAAASTCARRNVPAGAVGVHPPYLPAAGPDGRRPSGTVSIALTLDAAGAVTSATVRKGDDALRSAALATARGGAYRAEIRDCVPVGGTYLMTVDYQRPPRGPCPPPAAVAGDDGIPLRSIGCVTATVGDA